MYIAYLWSVWITVNVNDHKVLMHIFTFARSRHPTGSYVDNIDTRRSSKFPPMNRCYVDGDFVMRYRQPMLYSKVT